MQRHTSRLNVRINTIPEPVKTQVSDEKWEETVNLYNHAFYSSINDHHRIPSFDIDLYQQVKTMVDISPYITEMWMEHYEEAERLFLKGDSDLLQCELMQYAIFLSIKGAWFNEQLSYLQKTWSEEDLSRLLLEDPQYRPNIIDPKYHTSENLAHHLSHISFFQQQTETRWVTLGSILEFGGGYGGFCRLCRRINPNATHVVVDLPVFSFIQSAYLKSLFGKDQVNLIYKPSHKIQPRKINLVVMDEKVLSVLHNHHYDIFIGTWSLSETNFNCQNFFHSRDYFRSKFLFFGYRHYEGKKNPRQAFSDAIQETHNYSRLYRGKTFFSDLNHYFICKRKQVSLVH